MHATQERIQKNVVDKLTGDVRVKSASVRVSVKDGYVVTLSGMVPTQLAHELVVRDVQNVPGVSAIVDELALVNCSSEDAHGCESPNFVDIDPDQAVAARVTRALEQSDCLELDPYAFDVAVNRGIVTLEGVVPSWAAFRAAIRAAACQAGVATVRDRILIQP